MRPEYFYPMLGMCFAVAWGVIGTFRWYLKERMRQRLDSGTVGQGVDTARLVDLEGRVGELEERLDFAERLLAQARDRAALPAQE